MVVESLSFFCQCSCQERERESLCVCVCVCVCVSMERVDLSFVLVFVFLFWLSGMQRRWLSWDGRGLLLGGLRNGQILHKPSGPVGLTRNHDASQARRTTEDSSGFLLYKSKRILLFLTTTFLLFSFEFLLT